MPHCWHSGRGDRAHFSRRKIIQLTGKIVIARISVMLFERQSSLRNELISHRGIVYVESNSYKYNVYV